MHRKTELLSIKLLKVDKVALRKIAELKGESISVVVRRIIKNELHFQGLLAHTVNCEDEIH